MRERATAEKDSLAESQTRGSRGVHITALPRFRCPVWLGRDMASELGARPGLACGWCQAGGKTVDGTGENGQMEKIPGVRERCGPWHSTGSSCLVDRPPPPPPPQAGALWLCCAALAAIPKEASASYRVTWFWERERGRSRYSLGERDGPLLRPGTSDECIEIRHRSLV